MPLTTAACGGKVLDLGNSGRDDPSNYATPDTIAAEADAGPGVATLMARRQYNAHGVSVDETRFYWRTDVLLTDGMEYGPTPAARSCVKTDCAGTLITYAKESFGVALSHTPKTASNSTHLYWNVVDVAHGLRGRVVACPIAGCAPDPIEILATNGDIDFIVDDEACFGLLTNGTIVRCPATGCHGDPTVMARRNRVPNEPSTFAFAADGDNLYWVEGQGSSRTAGEIMTMPKDGSVPPRTLAPAGHLVNAIAAVGTRLYWSESHVSASVKTCEVSNCAASTTIIAAAQRHPHFLAVHGPGAAWFTCPAPAGPARPPAHGSPVYWPVGPGTLPALFANDQQNPTSLAIDETHLYWTSATEDSQDRGWSGSGGALKRMRLPK